jgi:7-carboxy-7-deazaguanine synthase
MNYSIKEIYFTLQGEGANTGRCAVFCRFAGCNLWTGREEDRATAVCKFCDTDFVGTDGPGGGYFATARTVALAVSKQWPHAAQRAVRPLVVCTGGEPLLQLDADLVDAFHQAGFDIAVETNGTMVAPSGMDWICVSPKAGTKIVQRSGDELKLVYPQDGVEPEMFADLDFAHFFIQPLDGPDREKNTRQAIEYCMQHPRWRLSLQTQKYLGIP